MALKTTPPAPGSPLEWWEEVQLKLLEGMGFREEAQRFREHPDEWREFRLRIRAKRGN